MNKPLPTCVIGAGAIGMRQVEISLASDKIELTCVVEPLAPRREKLAQMGLHAVAGIEDVPSETRAAIIATPTPDHLASGLASFDRAWAVLMEKPLCATLDDARQLIAASEKTGLPLITGHHRRCHPFTLAAREALENIGDLVGVQGLWAIRKHNSYYDDEWRRKPGAGPLMMNLSHEMDILGFLVGPISEVQALVSNAVRGHEIEDTASIAFRFERGVLGSILISDAAASPWNFEATSHENPAIAGSDQDYLRFVGTEGALAFPSLTRWGRSEPGEIEWSKPLAEIAGPEFERIDPLLEQVNRFADVVAGVSDDVLCTGPQGLAALEMTLAAGLSGKLGRPVRAGEVPGDFRGV